MESDYGIALWTYTTELYYCITELYDGTISRHYIAECEYRITLQNDSTELCNRITLKNCITESYYRIQNYIEELYDGIQVRNQTAKSYYGIYHGIVCYSITEVYYRIM